MVKFGGYDGVMKQSWKLRCIFVCGCLSIVLYLGLWTNKLLFSTGQVHKEYSLVINEVMINNRNSARDEDGDFEDWIEIYNNGDTTVNLKGFGLSDNPKQPFLWTFPEIIIEPKSFFVVWTSGKNKSIAGVPLHTNFKLKNKDKAILLTAPSGSWNNIFVLKPMGENISYGRQPDGSSAFYGFDEGTPGRANSVAILTHGPDTKRLDGPLFSNKGGFYTQTFDLTLTTKNTNTKIYYTLDGSVPTKESECYSKPIPISLKSNEATIVRARSYKDGYPKSEIITHSYFVEKNILKNYNIPVISLATDPENLFDYEKGIYIAGKVMDQWKLDNPNSEIKKYTPANYNQRGKNWEREGTIELIEPDGTVGLTQNIGIRISGDTSRANQVKSLSLRASNNYDNKEYFIYDFFNDKSKVIPDNEESIQFSQILLRSSGSDSEGSFFRDAFIQSLVKNVVNLDIQRAKPCILYINGEFYGIRNIREDYDNNYISQHYNMDEKDVVIIKNPTGVAGVEVQEGFVGDEMHYNRMIIFINEHNLKSKENYDFIKRHMDINNYIEYNVLQIYCDNSDWPGGNVSVWRKRTQTYEPNAPYGHDGRWRWLVFDLDHGFGLTERDKAAENNSLERATDKDGSAWPNPPWSTLLLRSLLENEEFKNQFINTMADRLNTIYSPEVVVQKLEAMEKIYYPYVDDHIKRWNLHDNKVENWLDEIGVMKTFAIERPEHLRQYVSEYFNLSGTDIIRVEVNEGGIVKVNSIDIKNIDMPWKGIYFKDIPITIEAIPEPGFVFAGWEGTYKSQEKKITISLSQSVDLKAVFNASK